MKFYVCVVAILAITFTSLCFVSEAALARAQFKNSAYPGRCAISYDLILSPGQSAKSPTNPCAGIKCLQDGYAEYKTCDAVAPPKGCKQRDFVNIKRPFPECCERAYDCTRHI
ncbi:uncharacterized protein [Eurosta solidaginis]|uniref:uncharacterized protein n=1 Tax=Eurosta solidaginis TaxID=178769 RepID=UPI0035310524